MRPSTTNADDILQIALDAVQGSSVSTGILEELAVPIYLTNAEGVLTYFNAACIPFAGRRPVLGQDSWCVTWKLFTDEGIYLPHDQCPMAVAIREKRSIRGVSAIAERPDGTRVTFMPFPTPLLDEQAKLLGAMNMLIDMTAHEKARQLRDQAARCLRLARGIDDRQTQDALILLAAELEREAVELEPPTRH